MLIFETYDLSYKLETNPIENKSHKITKYNFQL